MSEKRVIKKYPNRRLYDTAESKYITLEDVRKLVLDGAPFCVLDKTSNEDITRSILLQIIIEQEDGSGEPLFSTDALTQMVSFYGKSMQDMAGKYIQQSLSIFSQGQKQMQDQIAQNVSGGLGGGLGGGNPMTAWTQLAQQNMALWQRMQNEFVKSAGLPGQAAPSDKGEK